MAGALVYNDQDQCDFYENMIEEQRKKESMILKDTLSSASIMKGNSVLLTSSILNFNSTIINTLNIKHAQFFNYTEREITMVNKIETFMPFVYKQVHKQFLVNFLRKTKSSNIKVSRVVFCLSRENFIFPCYLLLDFCAEYKEDFCINAIITKFQKFNKTLMFNYKGILKGMEKETFNIIFKDLLVKFRSEKSQKSEFGYREQMTKVYNCMNLVFMFPQLVQKINFDSNTNNYFNNTQVKST